jgi:cytochrome c oxidase subunit III
MIFVLSLSLGLDFFFGLTFIIPFGVPFLNSLLLLSRAFFLTYCHNFFLRKIFCLDSLFLTIFLGFFFLKVQMEEYISVFFSFSDSSWGRIFFFSTGFHGFHVFLGLNFLGFCFLIIFFNKFNNISHFIFEVFIIYWHFVDVVWLFLFFFVYWWIFAFLFY